MCWFEFLVQKCSSSVVLYLHLSANSLPRDPPTTLSVFFTLPPAFVSGFRNPRFISHLPLQRTEAVEPQREGKTLFHIQVFSQPLIVVVPFHSVSISLPAASLLFLSSFTCTHIDGGSHSRINSSHCKPESTSIHPKTLA